VVILLDAEDNGIITKIDIINHLAGEART